MHQLEFDLDERRRFEALANTSGVGVYRRLVEKFTGSLPSWAERGKPGRPSTESAQPRPPRPLNAVS